MEAVGAPCGDRRALRIRAGAELLSDYGCAFTTAQKYEGKVEMHHPAWVC